MDEVKEGYRVRIKGIRPLLMHSANSMLDEKEQTRSKEHNVEEDLEKALYKDSDGNIVVPSLAVLSTVKKSAANFQIPGKGKKTYKDFIFAGLRIDPYEIPLISDNGWTPDLRTVVLNRSRIVRARPRFDNWELEFDIEILDPIISPDTLKRLIADAGKYNGLLDFRPLFGLFELVSFNKMK